MAVFDAAIGERITAVNLFAMEPQAP